MYTTYNGVVNGHGINCVCTLTHTRSLLWAGSSMGSKNYVSAENHYLLCERKTSIQQPKITVVANNKKKHHRLLSSFGCYLLSLCVASILKLIKLVRVLMLMVMNGYAGCFHCVLLSCCCNAIGILIFRMPTHDWLYREILCELSIFTYTLQRVQ